MNAADYAPTTVEVYRDKAGRWRWRAIAKNGKTISDSGEGYRTKWNAKRSARRTFGDPSLVRVVDGGG